MSNRTVRVTVEESTIRIPVVGYPVPPDPATIRWHRNRLGLSVAECARRAGVADRSWRRWESGDRTMPIGLWRKLRAW